MSNIYPDHFTLQDSSIPQVVRDFEAGFVDGLGEKGSGVHMSGKDKEAAQDSKKKWAFNKVRSKEYWKTATFMGELCWISSSFSLFEFQYLMYMYFEVILFNLLKSEQRVEIYHYR